MGGIIPRTYDEALMYLALAAFAGGVILGIVFLIKRLNRP